MRADTDDIAAIVNDVIATGDFEALDDFDEAQQQLFADCDLASLVENRLGETVDPYSVGETRRVDLARRATTERVSKPKGRISERCFWIRDGGARAGTVALENSTSGVSLLRVSSFYVFPSFRERGAGGRALSHLRPVLARHNLGLRLDTSWTWQKAVRWYLRRGLWVRMWKRDLELFLGPKHPSPIVEVGERRATLSVEVEAGERVVLQEAERDGDRLLMLERRIPPDPRVEDIAWDALPTLSLYLALEGWPLVRSKEEWERSYWADAGPPEALAYKITIWEAWARARGWRVETPHIPGLAYPTWAELEARWARQNAKIVAKIPTTPD